MSDDNPVPQERIAPGDYATAPASPDADDWEAVGRAAVATLLDAALADLESEARMAIDAVRRGDPVTIDHVSVLRRTLDAFEHGVEAHLARVADDAEPWEIATDDGTGHERTRFSRVRPECCGGDSGGSLPVSAGSGGGVKAGRPGEFERSR